ncbi:MULTISPECIES: hypothetical protein [unclassified Pseudomonas]|uniref:hypothetical protein n=1 Tax=unclassified Pseudomonas TaxID=196821 RepID=UPI001BCD96D0|nr:hypothetical protein [Pseudomonas sp. Pc102]BBP83891.1 hypothetical protein PHLH8_35330 [Pseudomonas sp. Pc102]
MSAPLFLISYLLRNEPMHHEVRSSDTRMSVESAREYLLARHGDCDPVDISDVQVSKITREHEAGTTPGHYQQP